MNQYAHTSWTLRDGDLSAAPQALAQTTDGYLWLGTESGLFRFDGVRLVPGMTNGEGIPSQSITKLLATRDGHLWIGTRRGLAQWRAGRVIRHSDLADHYISALLEDRDGTVWVGTSGGLSGTGTLCAIRTRTECYGQDGVFGRFVISLFQDQAGRLWLGAASGLWEWARGGASRHPQTAALGEIHAITESEPGTLFLSVNRDITRVTTTTATSYAIEKAITPLKPTALLRDRDGGWWIGTQDQGLLHVGATGTDQFRRLDGLSGDFVSDILEDREGNIWVATLGGLDRFRAFAVATVSSNQGPSIDNVTSVLADADGSVWFGTSSGVKRWQREGIQNISIGTTHEAVGSLFGDGHGRLWVSSERGLFYVANGRSTPIRVPSGYVHAMVTDRAGDLWISDQEHGLLRFRQTQLIERVPWQTLGGHVARSLSADAQRPGLWLGLFEGGLVYLENGRVQESYTTREGLGIGAVSDLRTASDGALLASTESGLTRIHNRRAVTLGMINGLRCAAVHWAIEDAQRSLWLHTPCGLVRILRPEVEQWMADPQRKLRSAIFDQSDGVPNYPYTGSYGPKVAKAADGRLWFATNGGLAVVDPARIPFNTLPPSVFIEQVLADGRPYSSPASLPPLVRDVQIDYTALSLIAPAKVSFRFKLEGRDAEWTEAGSGRQVFYSNLPPGAYRFRVIASNNDGVWNEQGASFALTVAPAFYQTSLFKAAVGAIVLAAAFGLYRLRLSRVRASLNARFEARLAERVRIAQELHDTLLQGFVSTSMQLQVATDELSGHPIEPTLQQIVKRVKQVIDEGRQAVVGLRVGLGADDLERAIVRDAEALRGDQKVGIRVLVRGKPQRLQPFVRDEIYKIAREAIANSFQHARPTSVEIEVTYSAQGILVEVRDDGQGIEPAIIQSGKSGHWGLPGMRERADCIGATLKVRSRTRGGTAVELCIPAQIAFDALAVQRRRSWNWKF